MRETLLFLLLGLGTGATIAAIAVGIVVTYRGSGFINLAAGAIAMLAGFTGSPGNGPVTELHDENVSGLRQTSAAAS